MGGPERSAPESGTVGWTPFEFDWTLYSDATFAGLSILIPIPLVDVFFEGVFRRRMPRAIAARRKRTLDPTTIRELNRGRWGWKGCLLFPILLVLLFLKRLFRTLLYFLTVKESTDLLSHYWHRAFLIDCSLAHGHLDHPQHSAAAVDAIKTVLDDITTSPLTKLAEQVVSGARHVLRTVLRWVRRRVEDDVARSAHRDMERSWNDLRAYFDEVARTYRRTFAERARMLQEGPS